MNLFAIFGLNAAAITTGLAALGFGGGMLAGIAVIGFACFTFGYGVGQLRRA